MALHSRLIHGLKQRVALRTIGLIVLIVIVVACAWMFYRVVEKGHQPMDATAQFLAQYWAQPLAPQGDPPPGYSPLEASLAPEACGVCHAAQYADWRTSLHSHAIGPGILWQLREFSQDEANGCLRCHTPLAEQKALAALQHNWANIPKGPIPSYVSNDLHLRGLVCAACHVRRHQRFGPPPKTQSAARMTGLPHNGFIAEPAFQDSGFCAVCHQFPAQGRSLAGKLVENTYEEWRASPAAAKGLACQNCHMPGGRHLWRGIHDKEMVTNGIRRELDVKRIDSSHLFVQATITTPGVGHDFPTYVVPKVTITLHLRNSGGTREIARHVIGRTVSVDMDRELSDTRIPPGGESVVSTQISVPPGANKIEMRMEVAPAKHYELMYKAMLVRYPKLDLKTQSLMRKAIQEAQSAVYMLDDLDVTAPTRSDETKHAVAN
jgi:hypothetical protein